MKDISNYKRESKFGMKGSKNYLSGRRKKEAAEECLPEVKK